MQKFILQKNSYAAAYRELKASSSKDKNIKRELRKINEKNFEPKFTYSTRKCALTIDYILHSPSNFKVDVVLELLDQKLCPKGLLSAN